MTDLAPLRNVVALAWIKRFRDDLAKGNIDLKPYTLDSALSEAQIILDNANEDELNRCLQRSNTP